MSEGAREVRPAEILVVDDDPKNLLAVEAALEGLGTRLEMVRSGEAALHRLLESDYALILLDVHMPGMDGFETARLIRARPRTRHVPIIFVTAYDQSDARVLEGYELGAVDFLFKPVVPEMLRSKAVVFVELTRRAEEVQQQAEQLRLHEQRDSVARLAAERQKWDQERLQREMEEQRRRVAETQERAEELAQIVAQREAAQRELTRINARLAESDRRKDEFLATLAHELRNPLAPMSYALGLLADEPSDTVREVCMRMSRQLAHLHRLVDDLLDVSRVTSGKIELRRAVIDLRDAVKHGVELGRSAVDVSGHDLTVDIEDAVMPVDADGVRIAQVISNLLNNAARYTDPGGSIKVEARREDDVALIAVEDDGRGIEPSMLRSIFEPFVQGSAGGDGLGLGLHLVDRLVRMHGGVVRAHSKGPGTGARFEIRLPLSAGDVVPMSFATDEGQATPSRSLRVAVVEDQDDVREMAVLLLGKWGHRTVSADRGREGIDLIVRHATELDLALIDIGLPDMEGYEVARSLREQLGEGCPPLVAVTGWGQQRDRDRALAAGFVRHLVKPVSPSALRQALAELSRSKDPGGVDAEPKSGQP